MKSITLYPSKKKWFLVSLIGAVFSAIGIWMILDNRGLIAWFCLLFFLAVAIVGAIQLLPGTAWLKLDENGFEFKTLGRQKRYSWSNVHGFTSWKTAGNSFVGFETGSEGKLAATNRAIAGADQSLPDTFGKKPEDLIALMTQYADAYWAKQKSQDNS